ncbi:hypothetical protein ACFWQ6_03840 [Streptomyces coelicoflavus]|uniref:hypothetical protein n=1 Tax=Streptomyces coelicoflavus TaxID=285562 RepID=UPI00365EA784
MPLVHVHGIGNREREDSGRASVRNALYRRYVLASIGCAPDTPVVSPWWGGLVAKPAWDWASLDIGQVERLGGHEDVSEAHAMAADLAAVTGSAEGTALLTAAHTSLQWSIDSLCATLADAEDADWEGAATFCGLATDYWAAMTKAGQRTDGVTAFEWLDDMADDTEFLERLGAEATAWRARTRTSSEGLELRLTRETFGASSRTVPRAVAKAAQRINRWAAAGVSRPLAAGLRATATRGTALLLGDIVSLFTSRERATGGPVVELVRDAMDAAAELADRRNEPLVVVAHSMGGNIVYDILSHDRRELRVELLVTVGSQVGLFEELKLFRSSDPDVPERRHGPLRVPALTNVGRWINVLDRADPLAFAAAPVFDGAEDLVYGTGAWWAHGAYTRCPQFHYRLAARVGDEVV